MTTPHPHPAPPPEGANTRYEVESELNPRYAETGNAADYYGVYHVVEYAGDNRVHMIRTFDGGMTTDRSEAYRLAGRLTATGKLPRTQEA